MLADFAGVSAETCTLDPGWSSSTTSFEVHNTAPARGVRLIAMGQAMKVGTSIGVSRAEVYAETGGELSLVCLATTTCKPFRIAPVASS
jgi:acyl-coenzyme A thioesterase PaaI-like protein